LLRTLLLTLCSSLLALCVGVLDSTLIVCHAHILIRHCVCAGGAGPVCTLLCVCHAHILLFVCGLHILLSLCHAHILIRHCVCGCISMHVCACMCMHACVCLMHTYSFAIVWGVPGVWPSHPPHMPQLPRSHTWPEIIHSLKEVFKELASPVPPVFFGFRPPPHRLKACVQRCVHVHVHVHACVCVCHAHILIRHCVWGARCVAYT